MSGRSRGARDLADLLSDKAGIDVRIGWDSPSPGRRGAWLVEWRDGPTVASMRGHAEDLVRYCRPLTITALRFSRFRSDRAQAAAMLALAHHGELPELPALACLAADHELADTDTATWAHLWAQAGQLVEQASGDLYEVVALIHATVTKPRHETTCLTCGRTFTPTGVGRPPRHCSPTCHTRAWRHTNGASH
jgi:hypothetical protein